MQKTQILSTFRRSAGEIKKTRTLVFCSLMLAIQVLLNTYVSLYVTQGIRITFGYLAVASVALLYGPVPAMLNAVLADLLCYLIKPAGPYFPGFTLSAALGGLVYGLFLYNKELKLWRILAAKAIIDVCINLLLNSLWLQLLYGSAFFVMLPGRAFKNLCQYPVDILLLLPVLMTVQRTLGNARARRQDCGKID
ncbi:MAG: folate family ECF transporter S component [Clostridia bacterium]